MLLQDYVASQCAGRRVLDVGCADHHAAAECSSTWLHKHIHKAAAYALGVDLAEPEVVKLRAKGYNMIVSDAQTVQIGERFDVIVAGEIIEHVDCPGALLRNLREHLCPQGRLILTTPNPFYALHWFEAMFCDPRRRWNPEHVAWFDSFTLSNLLARCGFSVDEVSYFARSRKIRALFPGTCPRILSSTLLMAATPLMKGT